MLPDTDDSNDNPVLTSVPNDLASEISLPNENTNILEDREQEYQALVQNVRVGIVKQDKEGRIILANNAALSMLGLTKDQMMGITSIDPSWNVIHEDGSDFPGHTHPTYIAMTTFKSVHDVVMGVYRPATNDRVWIMVNAEPQFDSEGNFKYAFCTFTDISEYKKVQDELHVKNNILHSIDKFSLDIVSVIDEHGKHIYVSKSATTISGYSYQELMQINALDLVPEKDKQHMQTLLNTVRVEGQLKNLLGKFVCKDGSIKYISWNIQWDAIARVMYVNGRDKTEQVKSGRETEAKRLADELQTKEAIFEEEEQMRNSIGYELHENVSQIAATVKVYLDMYQRGGSDFFLQESKDLLTTCIEELRIISFLNSLPKFKEIGFKNAVNMLLQLSLKKQPHVSCQFNKNFDDTIITDTNQLNIYRIIHLSLNAICKQNDLESLLVDIAIDRDLIRVKIAHSVASITLCAEGAVEELIAIKERVNTLKGTLKMLPSIDHKSCELAITLSV